jgi:branched-chain amino acid transport system substrate-binding protein
MGAKAQWLGIAVGTVALAAGASAVTAGGAGPASRTVTIYSSLPRHGASGPQARAIENGARMALADSHGKIGAHPVSYKRLDDSLRSTGAADEGRGRRNARRAADDRSTLGYIGEYNSYVSRVTMPILNRARIAQISPSNTFIGLTRNDPGHYPGEPRKYFPTGVRNYARVLPNDSVQAAALVTAARGRGCASVHVFNSGTTYSKGMSTTFVRTAKHVGLKVRRAVRYDPEAHDYESLASKVKSPCVVQTGELEMNGARLLKDVHRARPKARLYGSDAVCLNSSFGIPRSIASRYRCTIAALGRRGFGPAGQTFFKRYSKRYGKAHPDPYAIYGYESMALMLRSARRALGPKGGLARRRVVAALFATRNRRSAIGTYSIDRHGDTTLRNYGLYKLVRGKLRFDRTVRSVRPRPFGR